MRNVARWLKRIGVGLYAAIAGLFGGGGPVIADRKDMYGDDPANDPYSPDFNDVHKPRR
jgi:hypothetical protein